MKYLVHSLILEITSRIKHLHGKLIYIDLGKSCQFLCRSLIDKCTCRRFECKRIRQDCRAEQTSYFLVYLDILLPVHLIDYRGCTSKRLISEVNRIHRLYICNSMMIYDLKYLRILNTVNRLCPLIVIHKDKLFLSGINVVTSRYKPLIIAITIGNRKISHSGLCHGRLKGIYIIILIESHDMVSYHKESYRHTLPDKSGDSIGIRWCYDNCTPLVLCKFQNHIGYAVYKTDYQHAGSTVYCCKLRLNSVAHYHYVIFLDMSLKNIDLGSPNNHSSILHIPVSITIHKLTIYCIYYV